MFGRPARVPSSIVTSATESRRSRWNWVTGSPTEAGYLPAVSDWDEHLAREVARYEDGEARLPDDPDARQRQLTRMGNAAGGAGLALLMAGRGDEASDWFHRAAERYRESIDDAPAGSWGRPIGAMKALVLAGDWPAAEEAARWALELGAAEAESPIGRYAAALALLVLGHDHDAVVHADAIRTSDDFPHDVGDALAFIAAARRRRLHLRRRERPRLLRDARGVPRGHPRRRHRARPAGARRASRHRRRAQLAASPRDVGGCMNAVITIGSTDGSSISCAFSTSSVIISIACSGVTRPVT